MIYFTFGVDIIKTLSKQKGESMRQRFTMFMAGRNGNDGLNTFLLVVSLILIVLSSAFAGNVSQIFRVLTLVVFIIIYFRMFSRNIERRRMENNKYLLVRSKLMTALRVRKERWIQRKDYKFFSCPACKTTLRVPRGHGSINVVCRKCGNSFRAKS